MKLLEDIVNQLWQFYHDTGDGLEPRNVLTLDNPKDYQRYIEMFADIRRSIGTDVIPLVTGWTLEGNDDDDLHTFYAGEITVDVYNYNAIDTFLYQRGSDCEKVQIYIDGASAKGSMVISIIHTECQGNKPEVIIETRRFGKGDWIIRSFVDASKYRQEKNPSL